MIRYSSCTPHISPWIRAAKKEKDGIYINTTDMIKKKIAYEAPISTSLELRFESGILITSDPQNNSNSGYVSEWILGDI